MPTLVKLGPVAAVLGAFTPVRGAVVEATYWAGDAPASLAIGDQVRLPGTLQLTATGEPLQIPMVPTLGLYCVKWTFRLRAGGPIALTLYTEIPDVDEIDIGDLEEVDRFTYVPKPSGLAAWTIAVTSAEAARTGADAARVAAEQARDLALAGQFAGSPLGTANLNDIQTVGVYYQATSLSVAEAADRNYPQAGGGILEVYRVASGRFLQRYTGLFGGPSPARGVFTRRLYEGSWSSWYFTPSQRVDQTAGRAIYMYDLANAREQRIYGDTGARNIASTLTSNFTGTLYLRRRDDTVTVWGEITPTADMPNNTELDIASALLAGGFSANVVPWVRQGFLLSGGSLQGFVRISNPLTARPMGGTWPTTQSLRFLVSWFTNDPWPTALPGAASGSIIST